MTGKNWDQLNIECSEHGATTASLGGIDAYKRKSDGHTWYLFPCNAEDFHYGSNTIPKRLLDAYGIECEIIDDIAMKERVHPQDSLRDFADYAIDFYERLQSSSEDIVVHP